MELAFSIARFLSVDLCVIASLSSVLLSLSRAVFLSVSLMFELIEQLSFVEGNVCWKFVQCFVQSILKKAFFFNLLCVLIFFFFCPSNAFIIHKHCLQSPALFSRVTHKPMHFKLTCIGMLRNHFCRTHQNYKTNLLTVESVGLRFGPTDIMIK